MKKQPDILSPEQFRAMFPHAVPGAIQMNRKQWESVHALPPVPQSVTSEAPAVKEKADGERPPRARKGMNKTEAAFAVIV